MIEDVRDIERAKAWRAPPGLGFRLVGEPRVTAAAIIVEGELFNEGREPVEAIFSCMYLWPVDELTLKRRTDLAPRPAPVPPPPARCVLAPGEREAFGASVSLGEFTWPPGAEVELEWSFGYWTPPYPRGRIKVTLP